MVGRILHIQKCNSEMSMESLGEMGIFLLTLCLYQSSASTHPYRIALIADPQLVDENTYKRRGILLNLSQFYTDLYMKRNWRFIQRTLVPKMTIFLGDLMDGGREWDDDTYSSHSIGLISGGRKNTVAFVKYLKCQLQLHTSPLSQEITTLVSQIQSPLSHFNDSNNILENHLQNSKQEISQ
jgi:hypothetical protein